MDIERMAWEKKPLPPNATAENKLIYSIARAAYTDYEQKLLTQEEAHRQKLDALTYLETLKMLARSNHQIILELAKATAPRTELVKKDKAELLDIISRIEGIVTRLMKEFDSKVPELLRLEEK